MPRIRTIKPEFPQSESMGRVSREARLLFIMLWTVADDAGRTRAASRMLASLLYPYDDDAPKRIGAWLTELEREKCIVRYQVDGSTYLEICNWLSHQKIDKPSGSKIPPFGEASRGFANVREASSGDLDLDLDLDLDQRTKGPRTKERRASAPPLDPASVPDLDHEAWRLWLEHRTAIRKPIRPHSMRDAAEELAKLGVRQLPEVKRARAAGWQGLHPDSKVNGSRPTRYDELRQQGRTAAPENTAALQFLTGGKA